MSCELFSEVVVGAISQMLLSQLPASPAPIFLMSPLPKSHQDASVRKAMRQGAACKAARCLHMLALTGFMLQKAPIALPGTFPPLSHPVPLHLLHALSLSLLFNVFLYKTAFEHTAVRF